jgi:hypothetical protein
VRQNGQALAQAAGQALAQAPSAELLTVAAGDCVWLPATGWCARWQADMLWTSDLQWAVCGSSRR